MRIDVHPIKVRMYASTSMNPALFAASRGDGPSHYCIDLMPARSATSRQRAASVTSRARAVCACDEERLYARGIDAIGELLLAVDP